MLLKTRLSLLLLFSLLLTPLPSLADPIDDLVQSEMQKHHIPAISLAVLHDGQLVKLAAYGLANVELNVPATPQTIFQIQSITKTFTAAAILLLMEDGKLSLDDPLRKHLDNTPPAWEKITLRHLLSHTSGIKDFINEPTASLRLDITEEQVLRDTAPRPLNFPPGQRYAYSNTNYHLLAMIIRKLTGLSYGEFLHQRIFSPLGMTHTRLYSHADIIPNRAAGYLWTGTTLRNGHFVAESILAYGGGGILSTASDLAKWADALLSGKLLKPATLQLAWTPPTLPDGQPAPYALGWGVRSLNNHRILSHSGAHMTGFVSYLALYPDDALAVVVLANSRSANPARIAQRIAAMRLPSLATPTPKPIEDKEPHITSLLRDCIARAAEGRPLPDPFTPELWKIIAEQRDATQAALTQLGQLRSIDLLERTESNNLRTYRYHLTFANGSLMISLSLTPDSKIAGLTLQDP